MREKYPIERSEGISQKAFKILKEKYKIPKEYLVALKIYELTQRTKPREKAWYSRIAKFFEDGGIYSAKSVSEAIANLLRWKIIVGELEEYNGRIIRALYVSGEWGEFIGQIYKLYENILYELMRSPI